MDFPFLESNDITLPTIATRLLLSILLGGLLGWERERNRHIAGLRTLIIICVGSCLLMLISVYIPQTFSEYKNVDPGRIAAQVVSGIGFLGAGAIYKLGVNTHGLTTAATIWAVAAVGLATGVGMYEAAILVALLLLFVLSTLDKLGRKVFRGGSLKTLKISFASAKLETSRVLAILEKYEIATKNINVVQSTNKQNSKILLFVYFPEKVSVKELYKDLNELKNVSQISLGQDF
ncbi:MgtC/SapB family protein [Rufibacter glacialis]|uniref:MgtC/SapB family protein n=1 Tax=Rufibacter glacialis TaxID=1259555 RepID=A0A5M8QGS8_9BACT|nr:MgtC/SapB family protein [Rufibacter glacialis]KAA6434351.1 MgtC/SapB family protein [Rufibacter glacialis]GGK68775.1 methyltransferase [Rufibacter glacialis]